MEKKIHRLREEEHKIGTGTRERFGLNGHVLGSQEGTLHLTHPINHENLVKESHNPELTRKFREQKADSFGI